MKIEEIYLSNFKSFREAEITEIPNLFIVVGANGSGKSSLMGVFGFLKDCLTYNITRALQSRGGYAEMVTRGHSHEDVVIQIKYRMEITQVERLVTYRLEIGMEGNKPVIKREILRYKRDSHGSPYHFLDFRLGKGEAVDNEEDFSKADKDLTRVKQELSPDVLAIKGLGQFERFKAAHAFRQLIEGWHISDFHINQARGSKDHSDYAEHLSITGDNLQLVAKNIFDNDKKTFDKILEKMRDRIPGIGKIEPEATQDQRLLLKFQDSSFEDPFIDRYVSDGTIKMFAYLILLYDPKPFPILCIEEPENQLYPKLMSELMEEFREYANRGGQVFISTHSPDLLNAAQLDEVFWLSKKEGYTLINRAQDDEQIKLYMENGDKLGYLWKEGYFTGTL